ncbi:MAG TPA: hypothetical protein VJ861_07545 [Treponemataceae bacterium]|nr:hypothetical protein [Treponemataceae bacterium]
MDTATIPATGWYVIGFIAILLFILFWFKGGKVKKGDDEFVLGNNSTDKKINALRAELEKKKRDEQHDEELRKQLYRKSLEIDEKTKADMRRDVRSMTEEIYAVFRSCMKCEFPANHVKSIIKDELFQCIDENHMREKLSQFEISGYITDRVRDIGKEYELFVAMVVKSTCGESYPTWVEIKESVTIIIMNWTTRTRDILIKRINEKIKLYSEQRKRFFLDEFKENSVDIPVAKNKAYLESLQELEHE